MKWVGISGGWRKTNEEIENAVRKTVREIIARGDGIVSGGALGVDFFALDEAIRQNPAANRIKIFLPTTLDSYATHYRKRAGEGVIASKQAEDLIRQLTDLQSRSQGSLIEGKGDNILNTETYYERNSAVVEVSDELIAFHIKSEFSDGLGTLDTIKKAQQKGIPVQIFSFDLTNRK